MIGLVGPIDSVELLAKVASTVVSDEGFATRTYTTPVESINLARELDGFCDVILFTGRLPYAMAMREKSPWTASLQYIPHTGLDLYNTLVRILLHSKGVIPRMSIDTIDDNWVAETFNEIELPVPKNLMPFSTLGAIEVPTREELVAFHVSLWKSGEVEECLTCLEVVYRDLQEMGIPAWRIGHTRASLRDSLERALLTAELAQSKATHMALALVRLPVDVNERLDPYESQVRRLRMKAVAVQLSKQLRGHLLGSPDSEFLITTSRGMVDETISRLRSGQRSALDVEGLPEGSLVGFGVGLTLSVAEERARAAVALAEKTGITHAILVDGEMINADADSKLKMRATNSMFQAIAESLGIGPLSYVRLLGALRRLDSSSLTARQLAESYGIEARSARRILGALVKAGYASEVGVEASTRAGRPQSVFSVNIHGLANAIGSEE